MATKEAPYFTTEDESEYCGHVWRQRREIGGPWGFAWAVYPPHSDGSEAVSAGWRFTQEDADSAMSEALSRCQQKD